MRDHGVEIYSLMQAKLLDQFKYELENWTWDAWLSAGTADKEEIVANAIAEVGLQVNIESAYDLFYEWSANLTAEDFKEESEEVTEAPAASNRTRRIPMKEQGEASYRSEYQRLMSTREGREKFWALPSDERLALIKADREADPVQKILDQLDDIEFEYDGFERDWYEDRFDPNSWYGHYQVGGTHSYGNFTYKQDATTVFEDIRDEMIPKFIDKVPATDLTKKCKELNDAADTATDETEDAAIEALEVFIAQNLDDLVEVFYKPLLAKYAENAEEWAKEHLEPDDPRDHYDD